MQLIVFAFAVAWARTPLTPDHFMLLPAPQSYLNSNAAFLGNPLLTSKLIDELINSSYIAFYSLYIYQAPTNCFEVVWVLWMKQ